MFSLDKFSNVLGDSKEELFTKPLLEKKSPTKDVDEGTDELSDMPFLEKKYSTKGVDKGTDELKNTKKAVVTIHRKSLDKFEGQYKGSKGRFKLDSGFKKSTIHSELYKEVVKKNNEHQDTELYKTFIVTLDKEFINTKYEKKDQT